MTSYQTIIQNHQPLAPARYTAKRIIKNDAEALQIATELSQSFKEKVFSVMLNEFYPLMKLKRLASLDFGQLLYLNATVVQKFQV